MSATTPVMTRSSGLAGLGNMARREAATWWASGRWWRHALVWAGILAGLLAVMLWVMPALMEGTEGAATATGDVRDTAMQFPDLAAVIVAAGVVLLTQGIVLDERRNGVLEWLLSKPLARPAVILAKFVGHASGLIASVVVVPWLVVHALLSVAAGQLWNPLHSLAVVGILALIVAFHLAFVLLLSTLTTSRVAILAVPIVAIVSADGITGALPELFEVLPWSLGAIASVLLAEGVLVTGWPILATLVWTAVLLAAAAALLQRAEL